MSEKTNPSIEGAMRAAAQKAASEVRDGDVVGLGSGSAVAKFAFSLGTRIREEKLRVSAVPSSMQALILAQENLIPLYPDSGHCPKSLDIAIDGADQIAILTRSMVKGGGGQLLKEKIVLSSSKRILILADESKIVRKISRSVPVEIAQFAIYSVSEKLALDYQAKLELRKLEKGYPYYTESGNVILDAGFGEVEDPKWLEASLKCVPGVFEVGIFNCRVDKFLVGNHNGSVEEI